MLHQGFRVLCRVLTVPAEAFTSGFDLYMTKPVSFREVGRLLDNWQANGGVATEGVPHGAVTGESPGL